VRREKCVEQMLVTHRLMTHLLDEIRGKAGAMRLPRRSVMSWIYGPVYGCGHLLVNNMNDVVMTWSLVYNQSEVGLCVQFSWGSIRKTTQLWPAMAHWGSISGYKGQIFYFCTQRISIY
jgi:hypothetical protein